MYSGNRISQHQRNRGFSLMEVLVTLIVLSIGLLGLAGLQLSSLQDNHSAYLRSQATIMAGNIIDRMRANRTIARSGNYDIAIGTSASTPASGCTGSAGDNCTPAEMATLDLSEWKTDLADTLPSGDGSISRTTLAGDQILVTVTVQWDDSRGTQAAVQLPIESLL